MACSPLKQEEPNGVASAEGFDIEFVRNHFQIFAAEYCPCVLELIRVDEHDG